MAVEDERDDDGADGDPEDGYPDALDLLSDETRISILRELARAESPLRFAELRRRVGMRDSGTFNHHLSKLTGQFVAERENGYELDRAGSHVIVAAGVADDHGKPLDTAEEPCPVCGEVDCERLYHVHVDTW